MDVLALQAILRHDAERLAAVVAALPREVRPDARKLAVRVWQELDARNSKAGSVLALALELQALLRSVDAGKPPRSIWQMRMARPWPEALRRTLVAERLGTWQQHLEQKWQVRLALSAARLAWLDARMAQRTSTSVAVVRQPQDDRGRDCLELLHRRGRSRFS